MSVKKIFEENPKVSVIIPMYNAETKLCETMDSLFKQTYTDWEAIIVDDCSTDNSCKLAKQIAQQDNRVKVFKLQHNSGPGVATKAGFKKAKGGFVAFLDSDDLWIPEKLERQISYMVQNDYEFVCSDYEQIDEKGDTLNRIIKCKTKADFRNILFTCPVGSSTVVLTSSLLSKVDIPMVRKANDYALWLRLLEVYPYIYGMKEVMMKYRVWPSSISYNKVKKVKYLWHAMRKYGKQSIVSSAFLMCWWVFIKIVRIK